MSTYVMSDIHGCYQYFLAMLDKIGFSDEDCLIMAGDYIDRGKHSYEMLQWIEKCPENVRLIRGNHEEEFAAYVDLMLQLDKREALETELTSHEDAEALYESVQYILKGKGLAGSYFDMYGTIRGLLNNYDITLGDLCRWADMIRKMQYYYELKVENRSCIIVHAGYIEKTEGTGVSLADLQHFYLYAREKGYRTGGKRHGMIIAGHTPTIIKGEFTYNEGNVFHYYDKEKDCIFYDIDCGCVFRELELDAKLACLRLDDEAVFYV